MRKVLFWMHLTTGVVCGIVILIMCVTGASLAFEKQINAWLERSDATGRRQGLGNSLIGVKWRFYDGGERAWQLSTYPQFGFNNPGSRSEERALAEPGTSLILPLEVLKDFGVLSLNADLGYVYHRTAGHGWFGGVAVGRTVKHGLELAAELHVEGGAHLAAAVVTADAGVRFDLSEHCTLLVSAGREIRDTREPRASLVVYLGLQTRL